MEHLHIYNNEYPFKCTIIFIVSNFLGNLISLYIYLCIHNNEKPFNCNICNKSLSQKSHLTTHLCIHNNENLLNTLFAIIVFSEIPSHTQKLFRTMRNLLNVILAISHFLRNPVSLLIYAFTIVSNILKVMKI